MQTPFRAVSQLYKHFDIRQFTIRQCTGFASAETSSSYGVLPTVPVMAPTASWRSGSSGARATVLDGRTVAAAWERELLADVLRLTQLLGRPPGLGVVLVGSRPDSMLYVTKKQEACQKAGMQTFVHHLPDSVTQSQLEAAVSHACADCRVDGVLIQLPLPRHLSEEAVMEVLDPRKDVDGFHPLNMGRMLMRGRGVRLVPATPLGCIELLRRSGVDVQGKTCVVLGDSNIVGTPLAAMLRDRGAAAVTICHRRSYREWFEDQELVQRKRAAAAVCLPGLPGPSPRQPSRSDDLGDAQDRGPGATDSPFPFPDSTSAASSESFQSYQLPDLTRSADILVVAVGHPELVRRDWVRPGAVVIDVGINVIATLPRTRTASAQQQQQQLQGPAHAGNQEAAAAVAAATAVGPGAGGVSAGEMETFSSGTPVTTPDMVVGGDGEALALGVGGNAGSGLGTGNGGAGGLLVAPGEAGPAPGGTWPTQQQQLQQRNVLFQVVGDVAFDEVSQVAGAITPVPGGVGPMTIAAVLHNTIKAAKYRAGLEPW